MCVAHFPYIPYRVTVTTVTSKKYNERDSGDYLQL